MKAAAFMHSALFLNNLSGQIVYNLATAGMADFW